MRDWLAPIIIAGALILPDVAGFGIAGVRLDLKQAQDDIATLRQEANAQARASSIAVLAVGADNDKLIAAVKDIVEEAVKVSRDQASGPATPWQAPSGVDSAPAQDVP